MKKNIEKETVNLQWDEVFKIASGMTRDMEPRSAATLAIDKIENNKSAKLNEVFLKDAVLNFHISPGVAVVTLDLPQTSYAMYASAKRLCTDWFKNRETNENKMLTLTVVPYLLEGQIILLFDQLVFMDGYTYELNKRSFNRLILIFDNNATRGMVTEEIDYQGIVKQISLELQRMEEYIDAEIEEAIEEERKAKEEANAIDLKFKAELNNPLAHLDMEEDDMSKKLEEDKAKNIRFVDEKETMR